MLNPDYPKRQVNRIKLNTIEGDFYDFDMVSDPRIVGHSMIGMRFEGEDQIQSNQIV